MKTLIACALTLAALLALFAPGCAQEQTCQSVMDALYGANCTMTSGGSPIDKPAAVTWCEDAKVAAPECNCAAQLQNLLDCLEQVEENACNSCEAQFTDSNNCFTACQP